MTWKTYITNIKVSGIASGNPAQILIQIFCCAGYINRKEDGICEATAQSWINGKRNCKVSSYFPDNKLEKPKEVYNFFRNRKEDKLKNLQKLFCDALEEDSPIDCETEDLDIFCWSLVNQFLDLLGLQRLDITVWNAHSNRKSIDGNIKIGACSDKNISDSISAIITVNENKCSRNLRVEQNSSISLEENTNQKKNEESAIAFPKDCMVCYCCKNWKDDMGINDEEIDEKYGECMVYGKKVRATEGDHCDRFRENYNKAFLFQLERIFKC